MITLGLILNTMFWLTLAPILLAVIAMIGAYIYIGVMGICDWIMGRK